MELSLKSILKRILAEGVSDEKVLYTTSTTLG